MRKPWIATVAIFVAQATGCVVDETFDDPTANDDQALDSPVTIMGAGDIAESGSTLINATANGDLIRNANPAFAFILGDNAYPDGSVSDYATKYDPAWGSFKAKTLAVPGNHEYHSNPPTGYIDYFGLSNVSYDANSAHVWYAKDVGNGWRFYSLNTEVSTSTGSAQEVWLRNDLAAHPGMHYVAATHHPRYISGTEHSDSTAVCPLWNDLQAAGADLMLMGHEHHYERFAKMDCNGNLAANGLREIVVGTGGNQIYPPSAPHFGQEAVQAGDFGVLRLVLHSGSYDWQFIASGRCWTGSTSTDCTSRKGMVLDSGNAATNNGASGNLAPSVSAGPDQILAWPASASLDGTVSDDGQPNPPGALTTTWAKVSGPGTVAFANASAVDTTATFSAAGTYVVRLTASDSAQSTSDDLQVTLTTTTTSSAKHFTANEGGSYGAPIAVGFNVHDVGSKSQADSLPAGHQGFIWVSDSEACGPVSSSFTTMVNGAASDPKVYGYYLGDEPDPASCPLTYMRAHADAIHAAGGGKIAFTILTDWPNSYTTYKPSASGLDVIGLDPYPKDDTGMHLDRIDHEVNAALAAGIPRSVICPVFQTFGQEAAPDPTMNMRMPTASEFQQILARWDSLVPSPPIDYAYSWGHQTVANPTLIDSPELQAILHDRFAGGGSTSNAAPAVSAGPDQTSTLPAGASLDGTVSDDGLPNPPGAVTTGWSRVSGPGTVTFANAAAIDTTATFSAAGVYVLRLSASDSALSSSDDVQITVNTSPSGTFVINRAVGGGADDAEENSATGSMYISSTDLELVNDGSTNQRVGMRFPSLGIPRNATITRAYVQFTVDETVGTTGLSLTVRGFAQDNTAVFISTRYNVSARPLTTSVVTGWSPPLWTAVGLAGVDQRTPELKAIVQEIVNRAGWASGNALGIVVSAAGGVRTARAYEHGSGTQAVLHVEYTVP